jgi:soluble lytic murein transglycosylase-like protein
MTVGRAGRAPTRVAGCALVLALVLAGVAGSAHAGRQLEEPLADTVRTALAAAVFDSGPPRVEFEQLDDRLAYLRWLGAMSERLKKRHPDFSVRRELLETVWYESRRAGLDVSLVLGLIEVESGFRKYAISSAGARGYMQVMPFWLRLLGAPHADLNPQAAGAGAASVPASWLPSGGALALRANQVGGPGADPDVSRLFHLQTNLRFGCAILRHYLRREQGNLFLALGSYNGSRGQAPYPGMVLGARRRWEYVDTATAARPAASAAVAVQDSRTATAHGSMLDDRSNRQAFAKP